MGKSYNFPWFLHVRVNCVNAKLQRRARAGSRNGAGGAQIKEGGDIKRGGAELKKERQEGDKIGCC